MLMLTKKVDCVIDGKMLVWYLDHGFKLEKQKIKIKLQFEIREWLTAYIVFHIEKRKEKRKLEVINLAICSSN